MKNLTTKDIKELSDKFSRIDGSHSLPPDASALDRFKYMLCQYVVTYLQDNGLSQQALADKLGINKSRVSEIVHYKIDRVSSDKLIQYLQVLDPNIELALHEAS